MAFTQSLATLWSDKVLMQLEKALVYGSPLVCNRDYEGDVQNANESVKIHGVNDPIVYSYTEDTDINLDGLTDFERELTLNQKAYFSFAVDDIQAVQQVPKLMPQALVRAGYKLANQADQYVAAQIFSAAGTDATDTNWTSPSVIGSTTAPAAISPASFSDPTAGQAAYEFLVDLGVDLDNVGVPRDDRFVIVPPWFVGQIAKDLRITGYPGLRGNTVLTNGFAAEAGQYGLAGSLAGFNVIESLNIPTGTFTTPTSSNPYSGSDGSTQTYHEIVAGVPGACTFANQILHTEAFRPQLRFANAVKGLHVYGFEAVWPERIVGAYIAQGVATAH